MKVKKSYLVINDSIDTLLDKLHPKDFKPITLKIRPEEILIVDENTHETLHHHSISWVLSLGVFSEDSRLFGYIVTEARQGEKTRMFCHAFRCGRVTASVTATETIRLACQATFAPGRKDSVKSRRNSQRSLRSSTSSDAASSLELRYSAVSVSYACVFYLRPGNKNCPLLFLTFSFYFRFCYSRMEKIRDLMCFTKTIFALLVMEMRICFSIKFDKRLFLYFRAIQ